MTRNRHRAIRITLLALHRRTRRAVLSCLLGFSLVSSSGSCALRIAPGGPPTLPLASRAPHWRLPGHRGLLRVQGAHIALVGTLPVRAAHCGTRHGISCADDDRDGLTDAWEQMALDRLRPAVRFHRDERLFRDPEAKVAAIGRIVPGPDGQLIHVFISLAYSRDYGRCSVGGHRGDTERVALQLQPVPGSHTDVAVIAAYTAGHEGQFGDSSARYTGATLAELEFIPDRYTDGARWVVYASKGKHATFVSRRACRNAGLIKLWCLRETCQDEPRADRELLFPVLNAGELRAPMTRDDELPFIGERLWIEQPFCGGLYSRTGSCTTSLVQKLTRNAFDQFQRPI